MAKTERGLVVKRPVVPVRTISALSKTGHLLSNAASVGVGFFWGGVFSPFPKTRFLGRKRG